MSRQPVHRIIAITSGLAVLALAACTSPANNAAPTTSSTSTSTTLASTTTSSTTTTSTTTTLPATTTTIDFATTGAVVLVANASGVTGAAGAMGTILAGFGYAVAKPTNAAGNEEHLVTSKVYFLPAGEAAARVIAHLLGDVPVAPMPVPASIVGATAALGDANVLVMLGDDRAGKKLPG